VTVNLSMLMYSMLSVQRVYSVQLNCTDSNYRERETLILSVLLYNLLSVQIVYGLYRLQLICTFSNYDSNYTEAVAATCSAVQQHINCTNTVQTVQSGTELYLQ
jgi:hypothetical protein